MAYVFTRTASGEKLRWTTRSGYITLATNASNNQGLNEAAVQSIFDASVSEWEGYKENISIVSSSQSSAQLNSAQNRMYFSSDSSMFGSGVLAVTAMNYSESSGVIYNADIIINDTGAFGNFSLTPSSSSSSSAYLGDVITHEVGHLVGLNHSEVIGSTMVYNVFKGQYTIEEDDINGFDNLYAEDQTEEDDIRNNWIRGKVVGEDGVAVFGAHVQLINVDDDSINVTTSVMTEEDGSFVFREVSRESTYIVYVKPMKSKENISDYFRNVRSNFCNGQDFQPSFYSTCDKSDLGVPQHILYQNRTSYETDYDLGVITVRCSTPVNPEYLQAKFSSDTEDSFTSFDYGRTGKSFSGFTGYFQLAQIEQGSNASPDKLKIDLSAMPVYNSQTLLKVKVFTSTIGTPMGLDFRYKAENSGSYTQVFPSLDSLGKYNTDRVIYIPLSTDSLDNIFDLEVRPFELSSSDKSEIFGNATVLGNDNYIYHLSYNVVDNLDNYYDTYGDLYLEDNAQCLEGNVGESSKAFKNLASSQLQTEDQGIGCGTIDIDSDSGSGPGAGGSLFIGLLSILIFGFAAQKSNDFFV